MPLFGAFWRKIGQNGRFSGVLALVKKGYFLTRSWLGRPGVASMGPDRGPPGGFWPTLVILVKMTKMVIFEDLVKNDHFGHFWPGLGQEDLILAQWSRVKALLGVLVGPGQIWHFTKFDLGQIWAFWSKFDQDQIGSKMIKFDYFDRTWARAWL